MKKRALIISVVFLTVVLTIVFILKITEIKNNPKEHRRQSWLSQLNWDKNRNEYTGKGIKIGVIDTGVDSTTYELENDIISEYSVMGDVQDENDTSHGTAICSIITGYPHNEKEIMGVAPNAQIISIDVTDDEHGVVEIKNLISGIEMAIEENVDILNISVGCLEGIKELEDVIEKAISENIIIVCSAGNFMEASMLYPSNYESVISVGSMKKDKTVISPTGQFRKKVIFFPGENIVTAIGKDTYAGCDGTSFSTAICSGMIALLLEKNNDKNNVKKYLNTMEDCYITDIREIIDNYN